MNKQRRSYEVVCPKCGKARIVKGKTIQWWCHKNNKQHNDYFREALCNSCAMSKRNNTGIHDREIYQATCPRCERSRSVKGGTIRHWLMKYHKQTLDDYRREALCVSCSQHPTILIPLHKKETHQAECPKCGMSHQVTGNAIGLWLRKYPNKNIDDYYKEAPYCHRAMGTRAKLGIASKQEYQVICSQCHQTINKLGNVIWAFLYNHPNIDPTNVFREYTCPKCAGINRARKQRNRNKYELYQDTYEVICPKCNKVRTATRHTIQEWNRAHPANINKGAILIENYSKSVLCRTCACRVAPGKSLTAGGYILISIHPNDPFWPMAISREKNRKQRYTGHILEHRYIMAQILGRPLEKWETVHHRDGNKQNNDPSNLELRNGNHGNGANLHPNAEELLVRLAELLNENKTLKKESAGVN